MESLVPNPQYQPVIHSRGIRSRGREFWAGVKMAVPIMLGYVPIGFAYGILARQNGLSLAQATAMSLVVYAGSAQFIAVGMLAAGASAPAIVFTTLLVNLRHLLFSASLSLYFRRFSGILQAILAFGITDETYSAGVGHYARWEPDALRVLGLHLSSYLSWVASSFVGASAAMAVGNGSDLGLDFALPAMFIALLIPQLKDRAHAFVAGLSGLISLLVALSPWATWNVILATVTGATMGVFFKKWAKRPSQ